MHLLKRILTVGFVLIAVFCMAMLADNVGIELPGDDFSFSAKAAEVVASGTCGSNVTYTLDSDGVLTISGTGKMKNYSLSSYAPWYDFRASVKEVIIEDGVTSVGKYVFQSCKALTSVIIPEGVTTIGEEAFSYCDLLSVVNMPQSLTSIEAYAFAGCVSLQSAYIPENVNYIGNGIFQDCKSLSTITVADGNSVFSAPNSVLMDSSRLICYPGGKQNESYVVPGNVKSIGAGAFQGCNYLVSVTIPNSVTSIARQAFKDCSALASVKLPNKIKTLSPFIFSGCSSLKEITIPNTVTHICAYAFNKCSSLQTIIIPDSVTLIDYYAFANCTSLTSVTIPESVTKLGHDSFSGCSYLGELIIKNEDCVVNGLKQTIPASTVVRGPENALALDYTEKYDRVFVSLDGADDDVIASGKCGDDIVWTITRSGVLTISGAGAMYDYVSISDVPWYNYRGFIKAVNISDGITQLSAFSFCEFFNLLTISIPYTVASVGDFSFSECISLSDIIFENKNCQLPDNANVIRADAIIHGYKNSVAYSYAEKYNRNFVEFVCKHNKTTEIPSVSATCTENGLTSGIQCIVCGDILVAQVEIPSLGHDYVGELITEPTCTEKGIKLFICANDADHTYTQEVSALGHSEKVIPGKDATCTSTGLTQGVECSVCDEVITAQQIIPVLIHTDNDKDYKCDYGCGYEFEKPAEPDSSVDSGDGTENDDSDEFDSLIQLIGVAIEMIIFLVQVIVRTIESIATAL